MSWLRRLSNVFRRQRLDADIDDEMEFHVAMRARDLERAGMAPGAAQREAVRLLGNRAALRDRTRDADLWVQLETTLQDVRYACRVLWRSPSFSAAALVTLALGIGVNTAMFGVLHGVLIQPLPYQDADRLYLLFQGNAQTGGRTRAAPLDFADWRARSRAFDIAGTVGTGFTLTGTGDAELVIGHLVAGDLFGILGAQPALGRLFDGDRDDLMVLSHRLWQRRFGGDPQVVGTPVVANGRSFTIVAVMPPTFRYHGSRYELWVPLPLREPNPYNLPITRGSRYVQAIGRLRPGVSEDAARQDLMAIGAGLAREYPDTNADRTIVMSSLVEETVGNVRTALHLLFAAVMLVLVIACGNVTGLLLARYSIRGSEVAVRAALGATRGRLIRQFVSETVVLYATGTTVGLFLATWLLNLSRGLPEDTLPRAVELGVRRPVLLFSLGISFAAAVVFGLLPAVHATRAAAHRIAGARTSTTGRARQRFRSLIVVGQVAIALCLLTGAGLITRSLLNLQAVDKGFDPDGRLTFNIVMAPGRYPTAESMRLFYGRLMETLGTTPGFAAAGLTTHLPLSRQDLENSFTVEGYVAPARDQEPLAGLRGISPRYLAAMGISLRAGRPFQAADDERAPLVVVVNEAFTKRYLAGRDPIGARVAVGGSADRWRTIVGVARDVRHRGLDAAARPEVLLPYVQMDDGFMTTWARGLSVVVRTDSSASAAAGLIRERVRRLDPNAPVIELRPMETLVEQAVAQPRFRAALLASFALLALALSAVGIFGLLSYVVSERTREIGIRMAVGAAPGMIFRQILAQAGRLVVVGMIMGLAAGALLTRYVRGLLFGVSAADPLTVMAAAVFLAFVALLAAFIPARRATRVNPVLALRT